MAHQHQKKANWLTHRGMVNICSFCSPDEISPLSFREAFTKYAHDNPIISEKESLIRAASSPDANVTLAITTDGKIIGLAILEYPRADERWVRVGERVMAEVSVIEVSRPWRSTGIARELLHFLLDHPLKPDRIFYMVGYSWTWDLEDAGISPVCYRDMMIRLFTPQGFKTYQTNEPNIMLRPENLFMARIGENISESVRRRFKMLRFNIDD